MAKKGENRVLITLACIDCKERTYHTEKNKRNDTGRLERNKYCPRCRSAKMHREVR